MSIKQALEQSRQSKEAIALGLSAKDTLDRYGENVLAFSVHRGAFDSTPEGAQLREWQKSYKAANDTRTGFAGTGIDNKTGALIGGAIITGGAAGLYGGATGATAATGTVASSVPGTTAGGVFGTGAASFGTGASVPAMTTIGSGIGATTVPTATIGVGAIGTVGAGAAASELLAGSESASRVAASGGGAGTTAAVTGGITTTDVLLASSLVSQAVPLLADAPEMSTESASARDILAPKRSGSSTASREQDFETRRQIAGRSAAAAGVTRNDNEADLLGHSGRTTPRKRVGQQRRLLGY